MKIKFTNKHKAILSDFFKDVAKGTFLVAITGQIFLSDLPLIVKIVFTISQLGFTLLTLIASMLYSK